MSSLADDQLARLDTRSVVDSFDLNNTLSHLSNILIPRVSSTDNNSIVQKYITKHFDELGWHVLNDSFTAETPLGSKQFSNLIMTSDPHAPFRLVLAAHYDSKYFAPQSDGAQFVGATDSAVPCAMLLDLADYLTPFFRQQQQGPGTGLDALEDHSDVALQIVFFDGEEAFKDWTATDSIYGARHLASLWDSSYLAETHALSKRRIVSNPTEIDGIELLILLDLLGAKDPQVPNFFRETSWAYDAFQQAEKRLINGGHFHDLEQWDIELDGPYLPEWSKDVSWFKTPAWSPTIEDDHMPFLHLGVPVLHIIPNPFPSVWHTMKDDGTAVHVETCARWMLILRLFVREYLGLVRDLPTDFKRDELVRRVKAKPAD